MFLAELRRASHVDRHYDVSDVRNRLLSDLFRTACPSKLNTSSGGTQRRLFKVSCKGQVIIATVVRDSSTSRSFVWSQHIVWRQSYCYWKVFSRLTVRRCSSFWVSFEVNWAYLEGQTSGVDSRYRDLSFKVSREGQMGRLFLAQHSTCPSRSMDIP